MPQPNRYEQQFLDALRDIFVGAEVEGELGFINLMKIKSRYFMEGVFPRLKTDIDNACMPFEPSFREELFDKLYDFFKRYFSESGSIYFRHTPLHNNIYEKVYTDDRDVILFWKTHMLYYVKTDRLFNSMNVEVEGATFFFDVKELEHKRANEKRELIYTLKGYKDGKVILAAAYSEKGRKTRIEDILRALREKDVSLDEDTLLRACRVFEKQSEVDYFINKNARAFLKEQFDLWLYQYVFSGESAWTETRLRQLQTLKDIAHGIIDFIAQFEDELVRVWKKPKFVLNSHYLITLDKIIDPVLLEKILTHPGMAAQMQEWQDLGIVDEGFTIARLREKNLFQEPAHTKYQFLPLDTRYFPDLELEILYLFDDLDTSLDGWLVHSENYQALNTLLPKFRGKVQSIYIDPPYNASATEIAYQNKYKHSSWISLLEDRVQVAHDFLEMKGIICVTIDDYEFDRLRLLLNEVFGDENFLATVVIRNNPSGRSTVRGFAINHEYGLFYAKSSSDVAVGRFSHSEEQKSRYKHKDENGINYEWENLRKSSSGSRRIDRRKQFFPIYYNELINSLRVPKMDWSVEKKEWIILEDAKPDEIIILPLDDSGSERVWSYGVIRVKKEINQFRVSELKGKKEIYKIKKINPKGYLARTWWDNPAYSARDNGTRALVELFGTSSKEFEFPKALQAVQDSLVVSAIDAELIVFDFFAGSGTTAHAVINLNRQDGGKRRYILVEMGEHFNTVILPRVKKVVFSDKWKDGKAQEGQGISHFCKYFKLEGYEDTLRRARYQDDNMFTATDPYNSYVFLRDLKMLESISLDKENDKVDVHLEKLYPGIDLAETLSCVTGKWIKRITAETVEFQDGATASLVEPDWALVKPLVWW